MPRVHKTPEARAAARRQVARAASMKYRYGLTIQQYGALLAAQNGQCAICGGSEGRALNVDHDHNCCPGVRSCGACVRGLLCDRCNRLLGHAQDNQRLLNAAIAYLGSE